jgi:23S rRNA (cytosine1962-C5)-methyltransferase
MCSAATKLAVAASSRESWPEIFKLWALGSPNKSAPANGQEPFASEVDTNVSGGSCPSLSLVVGPTMLPCLLFEDAHLLVVNKPAGLNTHAPSPFAGEGIYEWLRHREPRWSSLAIVHRLDKETSGVLVFAKSPLANRSLVEQFTRHTVRKKYILLTDRQVSPIELTVASTLAHVREKYVSRPVTAGGRYAETHFQVRPQAAMSHSKSSKIWVQARPVTGRTHQIRVHAAERGFPVLGDTLYGGTPADRLYLHAEELVLRHPASGAELCFQAPAEFSASASFVLRTALIDATDTNAYRLSHGAADDWPGVYVDRLGQWLLSQADHQLTPRQLETMTEWMKSCGARGVYHKALTRCLRQNYPGHAIARWCQGEIAPDEFIVRENGLQFALRFTDSGSVGLFLDQRENRRRFLVNHVAAYFPLCPSGLVGAKVLNTFAYTCAFSVCAAKAGARVSSIDLSKKYLQWGKRNFALNDLNPSAHEFLLGDVFNWLRRLGKKQRRFDVVILDPPTFSSSKESGTFQVEKDYVVLMKSALPLLKPGGVLLACTNAAKLRPEKFLEIVESGLRRAGRKTIQRHYVPQPPDFPANRAEPAYLKTVWLRVE